MKTVVLVLLIFIAYSSGVPLDTKPQPVKLDDNVQAFDVDINAHPHEEALRDTASNSNIYLLYTRMNAFAAVSLESRQDSSETAAKTLILMNRRRVRNMSPVVTFNTLNPTSGQSLSFDSDSILASNFDPSLPTVAVCHGYTQSYTSEANQVIRDAYLGSGDFNVLILDWSYLSQGAYPTAIASVPTVGQELGALLLRIHEVTGAPLETMHVLGFSLGAHVAGNAGRYTEGRIGRVTGLDPFSPIWLLNNNRISSTDGIYVECIHTYGNNGLIAWGDADFYVNGGGSQPGCILSLCSHDRSWQIFAATVKYNHLIGNQCSSQADVANASCAGPELHLGNSDFNKKGSGLFYVSAGQSYPY